MKYIPALDGLRGVAVVAVMAYHAGILPAGYVGVDVFFAISGYVITRLLLTEFRTTGRIDFADFYARRVRRILPAAITVVIATLIASRYLLPTKEQIQASESGAASLLFISNFFFQSTTGGYFDSAADQMPLLHLWSLSVEEQFYVAWPILLLATLRMRQGKFVILALAVLSLGLAELWVQKGSDAAFFQTPSRFWELAAGGLIACLPALDLPRWLLGAGLAVIVLATALATTHFPGIGALPALAGTCLVIAALHCGARSEVLGCKALVRTGLVSYGLYLWHWPLLAYYRALGGNSVAISVILCCVAGAIAVASYRWLEVPLRKGNSSSHRTLLAGMGACASLAVMSISIARVPVLSASDYASEDRPPSGCRYLEGDSGFPKPCEVTGARIAVWGDSMAYSWRPAVERMGPTRDYSRDACPPFIDYWNGTPQAAACQSFNTKVSQRVKGLDTLVIASLWRFAADPSRLAGFERTLAAVAPHVSRILVIGPSPRMRDTVSHCLRLGEDCAIDRVSFDARAKPELAALRNAIAPYPNVELVDVTKRFCSDTKCPPTREGIPLYWDSHHVSRSVSASFDLDSGMSKVNK